MRVRLAGVSLFVLLLVSLVHGAMQAPVLRGVVTDHQGAVLPGLQVTVTAAGASKPAATIVTGADGRFFVMTLESGTYEIKFELEGFRTEYRTITIVRGGPSVMLSVAMDVGSVGRNGNGQLRSANRTGLTGDDSDVASARLRTSIAKSIATRQKTISSACPRIRCRPFRLTPTPPPIPTCAVSSTTTNCRPTAPYGSKS